MLSTSLTRSDPMFNFTSSDGFLATTPSVIAPPDFKSWCRNQDITEDVAETLIKEGFTSKRLLAMAEPEDIEMLGIRPRAQHRAVMCAIKGLKTPPASLPTRNTAPAPVPSDSMNSSGSILDSLLKNMSSTTQPAAVSMPTLPSVTRPDLDPTIHLAPRRSAGKHLEIIDFINVSMSEELEQLVSEMGSSTLVLKSGPKKPKLESLSVWQWVVGSLRIHDQLCRTGLLPGEESRDYLAYTIKMLELNGRFDWVSIMAYDKEYRAFQGQYGFKWGTDIPHLSTCHLREKEAKFVVNNANLQKKKVNTNNPRQQSRSKQDSICKDFNFKGSCTYNPCRYLHTCLVPGCGQSHPAVQHNQATQPKNM